MISGKRGTFLLAILLAATPLLAAEKKGKDDQSQLARLAIINFVDNTGREKFQWVSKSLPDAINTSMVEQFEFVRVAPAKAQAAAEKHRRGKRYTKKEIRKIAKESNSDILIYGEFTYSEKQQLIDISANIYHIEGDKIIGKVRTQSAVDDRIFTQINVVASKIVEHIYKYALALDEEEAKEKKQKRLRILVLVPTWETEAEKQVAEVEMQLMKVHLAKKYNARFLTLLEFYHERKIPEKDQRKVNALAQARNKPEIIKWLQTHGVKDAFIILVAKKKVEITPVVAGKSAKPSSYSIDEKPEKKLAKISAVTKSSGMEKQIEKPADTQRINLSRDLLTKRYSAIRLLGGVSVPMGEASDFVEAGAAAKLNYNFNIWQPWLNPFVQAGFAMGPGTSDEFEAQFVSGQAGLYFPLLSLPFSVLSIYVSGGPMVSMADGNSFVQPVAEAGTIVDFLIARSIGISLLIAGDYVFDEDISTIFVRGYLGVSYRL